MCAAQFAGTIATMMGLSSFALAGLLVAGDAATPSASRSVNRGGAAGLIRAASDFVGVDLLDAKDGHIRGRLTATEVKKLRGLVRAGWAREAQTMGAQWTSVIRIQTRSRGVYVVYLMDPDTLRLEIPVAVAQAAQASRRASRATGGLKSSCAPRIGSTTRWRRAWVRRTCCTTCLRPT